MIEPTFNTPKNRTTLFKNLSNFFLYINLPVCSSTAIIKKAFCSIDKANDINFNLIKAICSGLNLDWYVELSILREHLKDWFKKNNKIITEKYPLIIFPKKFNLLVFLKLLYKMFILNVHFDESFYDIYDIINESIANQIADKKFMKMTNILYIADWFIVIIFTNICKKSKYSTT